MKKRILSLFLALLMVSGLALPALADVFALVETSPDPEQKQAAESAPPMTAQTEDGLVVEVALGEDVTNIPEGSHVDVAPLSEVESEEYEKLGAAVLNGKVAQSRFVDITILDPDGQSVEPNGKVKVSLNAPDAAPEESTMHVVHFKDPAASAPSEDEENDLNAELPIEEKAEPQPEPKKGLLSKSGLRAESITLDKIADGMTGLNRGEALPEDASIPSDDPVVTDGEEQLSEEENEFIIEEITDYQVTEEGTILFETDSFSVFGIIYTVDFTNTDENGNLVEYSIPGGGAIVLSELLATLNIVEKEKIAEFIATIGTVDFSNPELVWIGKVEAATNIGELKNTYGLNCQYSSELTEKQIAEINAQTVETGDWVLISLAPFQSEETLTITMIDGNQYRIKITDAQISTKVLTADGLTFDITVTYDDNAQIPDGTQLIAEEIDFDSEEYLQYLGRTWAEINKKNSETEAEDEESHHINVNIARFFDLKLIYQGEEIEPKAPVQVEITYVDGLFAWQNTVPGVVHFTKDGQIEILEKVDTDIENETAVSFRYEQDSFSVIGTYIQQETRNPETPPRNSQSSVLNNEVPSRKAISTDLSNTDAGKELAKNLLKSISPLNLRAGEGEESPADQDNSELPKPEGHKSLVPNDDGTYTLTLSVKGSSKTTVSEKQRKANVLFIMDRSSSMITNTVEDTEQFWYYGTWDTATFRGDIIPATGYQFYGEIDGTIVPLNTTVLDWTNGGNGWSTFSFTYKSGSHWENSGGWYHEVDDYSEYPHDAPLYVRSKTTRLYAEQEALHEVINELVAYNTTETPDNVELALITFAYRRGDLHTWDLSETEHPGWVTGIGENDDLSGLLDAVDSTRYASGTNWEEALTYAYEVISAKEQAEENKPQEDYYVIFLTDGEPTNTANAENESAGNTDNMVSYNAAREAARNLAKYKFYNIFTYRKNEDDKYSIYLTNYAYRQGTDPNGDTTNDYVQEYYEDAQTIDALKDKLGKIVNIIADVIGHASVSITDTMTTDAMTTTIVEGKTNGYIYTVKDPNGAVLYTVTATGEISNPTVTFNVPASSTKDYTATQTDVGGKKLYSVKTAEGKEYSIALADVNNTTGELTWDLSPVGILMNGCTYSVSFVVWPDQGAYDYVAGLNNGLTGYSWDTSLDTYQNLKDTKGYEIGGVDGYPSIVKYPDGTFAVLTNTDQKVHYSVVQTETVNGEPNGEPEVHGPYYEDLETPNPMGLVDTGTKLEKAWGIERNPSTLAQILYDDEGNPTQFQMKFGIKILGQEETGTGSEGTGSGQDDPDDEQDESEYYTTLILGWDGTKYDWDPSSVRNVLLNGSSGPSVPVGTRWSKDFSIATGLMLSEARMDALGMDKDKYGPPHQYGSTNYYILETGHDYTIEEILPENTSGDAYDFDFEAPVYHPMLVDGKLKSVTFNRDEDDNTILSIKEISQEDWLVSLKIENNLRGYIRVEKDIVDKDGRTALPDDLTKFEYEIDIVDPLSPGRFTGVHIPWYGVDGLFYHSIDENGDFHYFQAETNTPDNKAHEFTLTTESGEECQAVCIDETVEGIFDEDVIGPTLIQYTENGVTKQISLYGNQLEHIDDNHVRALMKINQNQILDISNVPSKSRYTITETEQSGYNLVNIRKEIRVGDQVESGSTATGSYTITGTIVPDRDNHIIYKNKVYAVDLTVKKIDENNKPLTGATFSLYKKDGTTWPEDPIDVMPKNGEADTATYEFINLADGSYKLVETPPAGYEAVGDVFFTVTNGVLTIDGTLPDGVTKAENALLLTVKNTPRTDSLTIRKQWLDSEGNPRDYDGTLDLTLVQSVERGYKVDVRFECSGNGSGGYSSTPYYITSRSGQGEGSVTIQWKWNGTTRDDNGMNGTTITDQDGNSYSSTRIDGNSWDTGRTRRVVIDNLTKDLRITVHIGNSNWTGTNDNLIEQLVFSDSATGYTEVSRKTITLSDDNGWKNQFTVSGEGLIENATGSTIPATYNGKNCYYTISEESVPSGYTVTYSDNNTDGIASGVLTAYNQRTTEDVDVTIKKVWVDGTNEDGTTTSHQPTLTITLSNGREVTLDADNHWQATITGLPKYDSNGNEIQYSWTEAELTGSYYLSNTQVTIYDNVITTTLTNSYSDHYMPTMEIDGVKVWDDDGDKNRPETITVNLYQNGGALPYRTIIVSAPTESGTNQNQWPFRFTNLPIFNEDGSLAVYTVEEVLPSGYTSAYDTVIQASEATYVAGDATYHIINSYSDDNRLDGNTVDLAFVVVRHGNDFVVWTPRPLQQGELDKIKNTVQNASNQFNQIMNASGNSLKIVSGVPQNVTIKNGNKEEVIVSASMKDGDLHIIFSKPSGQSDIIYGTIPYTYTQIGGEGGVTITNVKKVTSISGTKTWVDGRTHNNSEEITLKLSRTAKPVTDSSEWEEVELTATGTIGFAWDGNTYTYSNLPRYVDDTSDSPIEYAYRVEETAVNVTEGTGAGQHTINYKMDSDGNNFINTELTNIEATKTWKSGDEPINATITNASVTFELQQKSGDNWVKVEQDGVTNPVTMSVGETADARVWKATWKNLPKYELINGTPVLIKYRVLESEAMLSGIGIKPNGDVFTEGNPLNINNTLPEINLSVTKQWIDTDNNARVFDEAKTISFTLYQKVGKGEPSIYTSENFNGVGTITYTPESGETPASWSTAVINNLPKYVYDSETNTWNAASYYVVEQDPGGVTITYRLEDGNPVESGSVALVTENATITIINADKKIDLAIVKVDVNGMTKTLPGAKFLITPIKNESVFGYDGDPVDPVTNGTNNTTGNDGRAVFANLSPGFYEIWEKELPDGYILTNNEDKIYIKVDLGTISLIQKEDGKAPSEWQIIENSAMLILNETTLTLGNTPGTELPHTGSATARTLSIIGTTALMIAGAGYMLATHKKKEY